MTTEPELIDLDQLQRSEYIRHRLSPQPGDPIYLHLLDLRTALQEHSSTSTLTLLDYGCGGSPYRSLFPNATYHRADYVKMDGMDFDVEPSGNVPQASSSAYDVVLSTQVLEHVSSPSVYLTECLRVLKPGGRLILTTHGTFPDHGCPYDFWRWTADGLRLELSNAGFQVDTLHRLTCGPRAILFWLGQLFRPNLPASRSPLSLALRSLRWLYNRTRPVTDGWIAHSTRSLAMTTGHADPAIDFCIALIAVARKPDSAS
jgi:SAM-dependent methyltransferase